MCDLSSQHFKGRVYCVSHTFLGSSGSVGGGLAAPHPQLHSGIVIVAVGAQAEQVWWEPGLFSGPRSKEEVFV